MDRKEKELADKVKYNWVNSDDEDYEKRKEERKRQKKSRREEKERSKTPEKEVKQERPDSDMESQTRARGIAKNALSESKKTLS